LASYKKEPVNHLEIIVKRDLRKFFYPIQENELVPPRPQEYLGKSYKVEKKFLLHYIVSYLNYLLNKCKYL